MGLSSSTSVRVGRIELGGFRLRSILGEGSFGVAYLADQLGTDRQAVVKIAHPHLLEGPTGGLIRSRFEAEVRAASRVRHCSLVLLFTAGTTSDGLPALATEYLPGRPLEAFLEEGLNRGEVQTCFAQIASGLAALHEAGIVHRDLSPRNVIVSRSPSGLVAKSIDSGVAKLLNRAASGTHAIGTPRYIAPAQIRGAAEPASDLYALGALLFYAFSGREYLDHIESATELLLHVSKLEVAPSLRDAAPNVSDDEDALVRSLLAPSPGARPTAAQFLMKWEQLDSRARGPKALLVEEDAERAGMVAGHLEDLGYVVVTTADPKRASRAHPGDYALIVVSAHLSTVDSVRLTQHLEEHLPDQALWVAGTTFGFAWQKVGRARCIVLPDDLEHLAALSPRPPSARPTVPRPLRPNGVRAHQPEGETLPIELEGAAEALIGGGAELIATLTEATTLRDHRAMAAAADRLAQLAAAAGASRLSSLSRALNALATAQATDSLAPLVEEVQSAYRGAVRSLLRS